MDLSALAAFVCVAEAQSIGRAAGRLGLGQPALSRRIQDLEDRIGVTLFERHPRGVRLTRAGEVFLRDAQRLLFEAERALDRAGRFGRAELGTLRIGLSPPATAGPLLGLVAGFHALLPRVELTFFEGSCHELLAELEAQHLDVAFVGLEASEVPKHLDALDLWTERLVAALPAGHPLGRRNGLGWKDLGVGPIVLRGGETGRSARAFLRGRLPGRALSAVTEHRVGRDSLLGLVAAGYGVTVVPEAAAAISWPGITFAPIAEPDAVTPVGMVWHPDDGNPVLRRFLSHVRRHRPTLPRSEASPAAPARSPSRSR